MPQCLDGGWHDPLDHLRRDQDQGAGHLPAQGPVHSITSVQAHLSQELSRDRDGAGLLERVRSVEDVSTGIHARILELS
jgi:hypothetical protein